MPIFQNSRIMPYDGQLIHDIILDIEKYPEFIPWCAQAKLLEKNSDFLLAELFIEFKTLKESYVSKVTELFKNDEYIIKTVAENGIFRHLEASWHIKKLDNCSQVDFFIDFEFKSKILGFVMSKVFSIAVEKMTEAFEKRAEYLSRLA